MARGRPKIPVPPCRFCDMKFQRQEHLKRHERIHTQERPFPCDCGQSFSRRDLLMRHRRLSHPGLPETATRSTSEFDTPMSEERPSEPRAEDTPHSPLPVATSTPVEHHSTMSSALTSNHTLRSPLDLELSQHDVSTGLYVDSTYEFELLWNSGSDLADFLPTSFFNTDYSLSDIWQTDFYGANGSISPHPTNYDNGSIPRNVQETPFATLSSRLPPIEPDSLSSRTERLPHNEINVTDPDPSTDSSTGSPWNITVSMYERITATLSSHEKVLPSRFLTPSRHTMSRYIQGYFRSFHEHFPFLHPSTIKLDNVRPELLLAMIAMGAFLRMEKRKGYEFYLATKALVMHYLAERTQLSIAGLASDSFDINLNTGALHARDIDSGAENGDSSARPDLSSHRLQMLQTLNILVAMVTWADAPAVRDALTMGSQLAMLTREIGLSQPDQIFGPCSWMDWLRREERRRTLFVSFILLNLTSITYDVPPLLVNNEIQLSLPHCNTEWVKATAVEWQHTRDTCGHTERQFQSTLQNMISGRTVHDEEPLSALGNYVLINALLQNIYFERQVTLTHTLCLDRLKAFESALQVWQRSWEATEETSLDPSSPSGPLGFNSAALLRLAYLRLNANIGPCRNLLSQDAKSIARSLSSDIPPLFTRSVHVDRAILQCIHALSIPVRAGIPFVAYTQSVNEGIQNPLCALECAILLNRWLGIISQAVQATGIESIRTDERRLLGMIASLIRETNWAGTLDSNGTDGYCVRRMGATVVRLWAETFRGVHVFDIVRVIGETLSSMADILEVNLG